MSSTNFMNSNTSITQAGRVVVNARHDSEDLLARKLWDARPHGNQKRLYGNASTDDLYLQIMPGEPLFMYKKSSALSGSRKRKKLRDTDICVFSALNGVVAKKKHDPAGFEDELAFMGFADIATSFSTNADNTDDAVAQVGGMRTTVNTGGSKIMSGDIVYWSLPSERDVKSHSKVVAQLCPLKKRQIFTAKGIESTLMRDADEKGKFSGMLQMMQDVIKESEDDELDIKLWSQNLAAIYEDFFIGDYAKLRSKIVGTAFSDAKPGQEFDILVGSYCV